MLLRPLLSLLLLAPTLPAQIDSFADLTWKTSSLTTVEGDEMLQQLGYALGSYQTASTVMPEAGRLSMDFEMLRTGSTLDKIVGSASIGCEDPAQVQSAMLLDGEVQLTGSWNFQVAAGQCLELQTRVDGWGDDDFWVETRFTNLQLQPPLSVDTPSVSLAAGGTQVLDLLAPLEEAGQTYLLLGSRSGTTPGLAIGLDLIPLNLDGYLIKTATAPAATPLSGSFGTLDANGGAQATLVVPAGVAPQLAGESLHHAFVVLDSAQRIQYVSNPVELQLLP